MRPEPIQPSTIDLEKERKKNNNQVCNKNMISLVVFLQLSSRVVTCFLLYISIY